MMMPDGKNAPPETPPLEAPPVFSAPTESPAANLSASLGDKFSEMDKKTNAYVDELMVEVRKRVGGLIDSTGIGVLQNHQREAQCKEAEAQAAARGAASAAPVPKGNEPNVPESPVVKAGENIAPSIAVGSDAIAPAKPDRVNDAVTKAVNVMAVIVVTTALGFGYWLPTIFAIDYSTAGFIGFGFGAIISLTGTVFYFRYLFLNPAQLMRDAKGHTGIHHDPEMEMLVAEYAADSKELGIDREQKARFEKSMKSHTRALAKLVNSAEYKAVPKVQQDAWLKQFTEGWVKQSLAEANSHSEEDARRIQELRNRRELGIKSSSKVQTSRSADLRRLRDMESRAQAGGFTDEKLLAEIQELQRRLYTAK